MTKTLLAAAVLLACPTLHAADAVLSEGQQVALKLPAKYMDFSVSKWGRASMTAEIAPGGPSGVTVNGDPDWQSSGFPSLAVYLVAKVKGGEVELKTPSDLKLKLKFTGGGAPTMFPKVVVPVTEREAYRREMYTMLAAKHFTGPLATLPEEKKMSLLAFADNTAKSTTIGSATYKEKQYLVVNLGSTDVVYNDLKLNQAARLATVMNERVLTLLKGFAAPVSDVGEIHGLKIEYSIGHRDFLNTTAGMEKYDRFELYAPSDAIKKFAEADITSQQLLDGSVAIVNDNRVQVSLSEQ
jgi:hypothetical protein